MDYKKLEVVARYDDDAWWAVVKDGDKVVIEPYIYGKDPRTVILVAEKMFGDIIAQFEDEENNYGLLFYHCGYDGRYQQETMAWYKREYGVDVF